MTKRIAADAILGASESDRGEAGPATCAGRGAVAERGTPADRARHHYVLNHADGTSQLLTSGSWILLVGLVAGALTALVFGGVTAQGAHSNAGWLSLMVAMMSTPFAILLLLLGGAKWLRNYSLSKQEPPEGN